MPSVAAGDIIAGKYRVERMLGSGGMGYVVAARHIELDRLVAIKFLGNGALGADDDALARFRREARSTVRLTSDHIAKVHDVGVHDTNEPYIVMDYLDGADLGTVASERGALPVAEACDLVIQACVALGEAHSKGIVHRDVKLANLFVTRSASGRPILKVLDFGISKASGDGGALDVTRTQALLGSPRFMSPEQMNDARTVDGRTDVWSLGVVLYRLVAGRPAFDGDTLGLLCAQVLTGEPRPLHAVVPWLPSGFEQAVLRCLVKDRTHRCPDVAQLAASLAPFTSDPESAFDRAEHIAAMLGTTIDRAPVAPPVPTTPRLGSATDAGQSGHAWSPGTTGETAIALPLAQPARDRMMGFASIALAVVVMAFAGTGAVVYRTTTARAAAASAAGVPAFAAAPAPLGEAAPLASASASATATPREPTPVVMAAAPPIPVPVKPVVSTVHTQRKPSTRTAAAPAPADDGVPLPSDRK